MSTSGGQNNLLRLLGGLSLIVKEITKRSRSSATVGEADFRTLFSLVSKRAIVFVTDTCGLTRGGIHHISHRPTDSIVSADASLGDETPTQGKQPSSDIHENKNINCNRATAVVNRYVCDVAHLAEVDQSVNKDHMHEQRTTVFTLAQNPSLVEQHSAGTTNSCVTKDNKVDEGVEENTHKTRKVPEESLAEIRADSSMNVEPNANYGDGALPNNIHKRRKVREVKVPSTPFSRALGFVGLGAELAWGAVRESSRRLVFGSSNLPKGQYALSSFLSERNAQRLALALCKMRGAALKVGQMLSIQDESLVPAPILMALDIVREGADVMPRSQLKGVLDAELGHDWSSKLSSFDFEPVAAASIGQVHRAVMEDGRHVVLKIQYPGVAESISSDIENVKLILDYTSLIPKGLFLERAMKVAKEELSRECDYELEAANQKRFSHLLSNVEGFFVPNIIDELSTKRVLTSEFVSGVPIDKVALLDQETRNYVGKKLLQLTLTELFLFRFMQTDPNWSNFLYDNATKTINLIDFGAARDYPKPFVDNYLRMVMCCANGDRDGIIDASLRLGFLTGTESEIMLDAHVQAAFVVGLPFSKPGGFDFRSTNITQCISNLSATMLKHRLTPPPDEAYSLHRKLSGAFLACIKLGAVVPCRELLLDVYRDYEFGPPEK